MQILQTVCFYLVGQSTRRCVHAVKSVPRPRTHYHHRGKVYAVTMEESRIQPRNKQQLYGL